jgi:hypothetical protein
LEEIINESGNLLNENENLSFDAKNKLLNEKGCFFSAKNYEIKNELLGLLYFLMKLK